MVTLAGLEPATSPALEEQGRSIPLELQRRHDFYDRLWRRKGGHLCKGMSERSFPPPWAAEGQLRSISVGPLSLTPPVEYAADASASVERSLLPRVQGVIKRLELGLDCLQAGKPDLRLLFGERHSARHRRKIRLVRA